MKALISDIHGNFEALKAVMADIDAHHVEQIYFLGDVVGYGPEPEECIDLIEKRCCVHLMGNHDYAMLNVPVGFNPIAAGAIECLKVRMEPGIYSMPWKRRRWEYLGNLKHRHMEGDSLFVHASPRDPISEYILPSDPCYDLEKLESIFQRVEHVAFVGHTHIPGVMTTEPTFLTVQDIEHTFTIGKEKVIINIGSVGQPRDMDKRACYVLLDGDQVIWRRLDYDVEKTVESIKKVTCLHERNGERLREGR